MACVNGRTDPDLWEKSKKKAIARLGGRFSARAMQLAGKLYRDAGGGYCGDKTKAQKSMSKWSSEDWTTADGKPARRTVDGKVVYDRYLPKAAWSKLSKTQKIATRRKKRASDRQFVANTAKAAKAGKAVRGESMSVQDRMARLLERTKFLHDPDGSPEDEGEMAQNLLSRIQTMSEMLSGMMVADDQLPGWVQSHITVAHENLAQVMSYMEPKSRKSGR